MEARNDSERSGVHSLISLVGRFARDESGAFLALFGVIGVVLIAVAGAVVDYTQEEQARTRAQVALDAAALGLQPMIYTQTPAYIQTKAQELLTDRIGDSRIAAVVNTPTIDTSSGTLTLTAQITVPMYFVTLVGIPSLSASLTSQSTRKQLNIEVVMVLDNSGSMADNQNNNAMRMSRLKSAATSAVDIIFGGLATQPNVYMGVVPFNGTVNVGTTYKTATWMNQTGNGQMSNDNFDNDNDDATAYTAAVNRFTLYNQLSNVSWAGCVNARISPYDTDDTTPSTGIPDTLFTPQFAPDEPDTGGFSNNYLSDTPAACEEQGSCTYIETATSCNNQGSCSGPTSYSATLTGPNSGTLSCSCPLTGTYSQFISGNGSNRTRTRTYTCPYNYDSQGLSQREYQERLCKYTGSISGRGPNLDCVSTALLPLTNVAATVKSKINAMVAAGTTNIAQGAEWGLHVLSPTEPFTQGKAYTYSGNLKVMIVMTDGDNNAGYNTSMNMSTSGAYGYLWNGWLTNTSSGAADADINSRLLAVCTYAKAAPRNITIYTIGLSATNQTSINMLTSCASSTSKAYFPAQSSELNSVFTEIANQLAELRLSQ